VDLSNTTDLVKVGALIRIDPEKGVYIQPNQGVVTYTSPVEVFATGIKNLDL